MAVFAVFGAVVRGSVHGVTQNGHINDRYTVYVLCLDPVW
jgi:hypothetical protein